MTDFIKEATSLDASDAEAVARHLAAIQGLGAPRDLLDSSIARLKSLLPSTGDTDRVVINLLRFLETSRSPLALLALLDREPDAMTTLVRLFATSQYMADQLIASPESFDLLRLTDGQPVAQELLQDEILTEIEATDDARTVMKILRDYRHRETLRIAYGDFICGQGVRIVTQQITTLCDCIVTAALAAARRDVARRSTKPRDAELAELGFVVLSLGKLGGSELNYSSDIDLIFVYEATQQQPEGRAAEYFQRVAQTLIRYLSEVTEDRIAYRVDMRLRPHGARGALVVDDVSAHHYYDMSGRTWERQAFIKARVVAGDRQLGDRLLQRLQPWIYRQYLMRADISGVAALKRRIERRSKEAGEEFTNVKEGRGGIRDVEYVVQFLQLLHGGEDPRVRCQNTLETLLRLEQSGCITANEREILDTNYCYLRQLEHYLQIMFDRRAHTLPTDPDELIRFIRRVSNHATPGRDDQLRNSFEAELRERTLQNRKILDHLLHNAFDADDDSDMAPETDLVLDPEPSAQTIAAVLEPYGFQDVQAAYRHLQALASESIKFLSTRRSRHFLSAIAPKLLTGVAATPSPDSTLIALAGVSDSIGGKAVLWELFSSNAATMDLCLRMCACSPYLTGILTGSPGMIDELLDSLMLDSLPTHNELIEQLTELCRGADEIGPILHSFKNSMHLRVGVRNLLGKDTIEQTHAALADIAEVCLEQVVQHEFHRLVRQLGVPVRNSAVPIDPSSELAAQNVYREGAIETAELVVLAVGKLGGREPNYHSDIDLIFLFDGEGITQSLVPDRRFKPTTNRHFFNQLTQRVIHAATRVGTSGKLFDVDVRLRPLGRSGELAITIDDLRNYFDAGGGQIWERQALTKARPVWGSEAAQRSALDCIRSILQTDWNSAYAQLIYEHRRQLEADANYENLKRGVGGTMDVEFTVQMLQLASCKQHSECLVPGTLAAIDRLAAVALVSAEDAETLSDNYRLLREVESAIRLMNSSARHELPREQEQLDRLAFLLSAPSSERRWTGQQLERQCRLARASNRSLMESIFADFMPPPLEDTADEG